MANGEPVIQLRAPSHGDLEEFTNIRQDVGIQHSLLAYPPAVAQDVEGWLARKQEDSDCVLLTVADSSDAMIGYIQFAGIHRKGRYASFGIAISRKRWGKGYGSTATSAALDFARTDLKLRKVLLEVRADNSAAIRIYEAFGFRLIGTLKSHYDDGVRWNDVHLMECFLEPSP